MPRHAQTLGRPGRPVANPRRDARHMLLTAATELCAERGVAATSFATIAKRAGLTPAMVHYYFHSRDQLLDAIVDERLRPFIQQVWDPVEEGADPADTIRGVVDRLLTGIAAAPWIPSAWMREILNDDGLLRARALRHVPRDKLKLLAQAIHRGQADQRLNPDLDPLLAVFSTIGLVMLQMATANVWAEIFHRKPLSREAMGRHITGLVLDGLRGPGLPRRKRVRTTP